jgi:hypothetical protein
VKIAVAVEVLSRVKATGANAYLGGLGERAYLVRALAPVPVRVN